MSQRDASWTLAVDKAVERASHYNQESGENVYRGGVW